MVEIQYGEQTVRCDRAETARMYGLLERGEAEACTCDDCKWFVGNRAVLYPQHFRALLERLGIDWTKENEVTCAGDPTLRYYNGNFDFVGSVQFSGDSTGLSATGPESAAPGSTFSYGFSEGAGYPWTALRAQDMGFAPIACVWFGLCIGDEHGAPP